MRIARKITLWFELAIVVLVAVYAVVEISGESRAMRAALRSELVTLASETGVMVAKLEPRDGRDLLRRATDAVDDASDRPQLRWVEPSSGPGSETAPVIPSDQLGALAAGATKVVETADRMFVYRGFEDRLGRLAAIETSQSTDEIDRVTRRTTITTIALVALIIIGGSVYSLTIGGRVIARPIRQLVAQFRRVGAGDLQKTQASTRDDEMGELQRGLTDMIDQLAASRAQAEREHTARITTMDQLRHADRLTTVGKLASGMAHELGTPLNVIAGYAKLIATRQETGDGAVESAELIGEQVDRVTALVRQLLDFARRGELKRVTSDVRATVARAVSLVSVVANKSGVRLVHVEPEQPLLAALDDGKLQQVIVNLAINAVQASPSQAKVELTVTRTRATRSHSYTERDHVRIDVIDHGTGIAPEHLHRVFEPFFTTKLVGEGTGLGLAVSYGIVDEHDGWIEVANNDGGGSRFSVFLPLVDPT